MKERWKRFWNDICNLKTSGWLFRQGLVLSFFIVFLISVIGGRIVYQQLRLNTTPDTSRIELARENVYDIFKILNTLYQTEAYARSYIQTFDESYHQGYHLGMDSVAAFLELLSQRQVGETGLKGEIDTITALMIRKNENMERLFDMARESRTHTVKEASRRMIDSLSRAVPQHLENVRVEATEDTSVYIHTRPSPKMGFFQRLAQAFKKDKVDTVYYVHQKKHILQENQISTVKDIQDSLKRVIIRSNAVYDEIHRVEVRKVSGQIKEMLQLDQELNRQMMGILRDWQEAEVESSIELLQNRSAELRRMSKTMSLIGAISFFFTVFFVFVFLRSAFRTQEKNKALEVSEAEKAELLAKRDHLMKSIAHDIKSPLSTIIGSTDVLSRVKMPGDSMKYVMYTKAASAYLLELVNNLLDYVRWQRGDMKSESTLFCPTVLFNDIQFVYRLQAEGKGLSFLYLAQGLPIARQSILPREWFKGDALRIRQITSNLLSNSIKYTSSGLVTLSVEWDDTHLTIKVNDTGKGISKDDIGLIFKEFVRIGKDSAGIEGAGLGLSVTKKWVDLLGGTLTVESEEGHGALFVAQLPLEKVDAAEVEKKSMTNRFQAARVKESSSLANYRVAVIDDDVLLNRVLGDYLRKMGMEVRSTTNPEELLSWVAESWPHMVITDLQMPDISGYQVLRRVKAVYPELPVILLTGKNFVSLDEKEEDDLQQFSAYVRKPVDFSVLMQVMEQVLHPSEPDTSVPLEEEDSYEVRCTGTEEFDLADIYAFIGENKDEIDRFMDDFFETAYDQLEDLKMYKEDSEMEKFRSLCHKMASMFGQLKIKHLYDLLRSWENGTVPDENDLDEFETRLHEIDRQIRDFLK